MNWQNLGISPCELLIPSTNEYFESWACVACDQFTSQPEYWEKADQLTVGKPSTLHMIVPECRLNEAETLVPRIHREMDSYLDEKTLAAGVSSGMVLTERTTQSGTRIGLVLSVDLECYDYRKGANSLIRATEMTIESRIPARVKVRRGAALETSHVLMLCDDPMNTVIMPIWKKRESLRKLYDFELMLGGGHVTGWAVEDECKLQLIADALGRLKETGGENPLLFAVGDGNHSLASAKSFWEETKKILSEEEISHHPARYAMVELENIHDPALRFEPIHRAVFNCDAEKLQMDMEAWITRKGMRLVMAEGSGVQSFTLLSEEKSEEYHVADSPFGIAVATVQNFLDEWISQHPDCVLDYIHGGDVVRRLAAEKNTVGFLLPKPDGSSLFEGVIKNGCLPRKTFSLGEANEKRYYLECRKIKP